jgi:pyridoxine 4-dehydrogenase
MTATNAKLISQSGMFELGELSIHRLGYGAMRLTGPGIWGPPKDRARCVAVLRRAVELGVNFIDTADSYGPNVSEEIIREALHPYAKDLLIATKAGLARTGPNVWVPLGRPEYLRQQCETSCRRLGVERIDLFQLHRIDPKVPAAEQFGVLKDLVSEGKVRHVGLSEVSVGEIEAARAVVPIASVQNRYNLTDRASEAALEYCAKNNIAFIPWYPIAAGALTKPGALLDKMAQETGATPSQLALAWLLKRSPVILPIPGTSSVEHLEENCGAANVRLTDTQFDQLSKAVA